MKPQRINNWIVALGMFRPDDKSDTEWDTLTPEERAQHSDLCKYRVRLDEITEYNESSSDGCTTITTPFSRITLYGSITEFDEIILKS